MDIGQKLDVEEFMILLENTGVRADNPDFNFDSLLFNLSTGWMINHVTYKPRAKLWHKGQPVFQFVLEAYPGERVPEHLDIPVGPKVKQFILDRRPDLYYVRNVPYRRERGTPEEKLLVE